jgi:hypothetical protein
METWIGDRRRGPDCTKSWNPKDFLPPRYGVAPDGRRPRWRPLGQPKRRPPIHPRPGSDKIGTAEWVNSINRSIGRKNGGETWNR